MAKDNETIPDGLINPVIPSFSASDPLRDFKAADAFMTEILSFHLRVWQSWFVTVMTPHRIEILPLAGASPSDLPTRRRIKSPGGVKAGADKQKPDSGK